MKRLIALILILAFIWFPVDLFPDNSFISRGGTPLGYGNSGLDFSADFFRWLKAEYNFGISDSVDLGIWWDFQPVLMAWSTIGISCKLGYRYSKGTYGFRAGAGYAIGVLGDNIAGHGIEFSGEGSQGFLCELEAMKGTYINRKLSFIKQIGFLITNQRNTNRAQWGGNVNKLTFIPYLGIGIETLGEKVNFFINAQITYFDRINSGYDIIFPNLKLGINYWF